MELVFMMIEDRRIEKERRWINDEEVAIIMGISIVRLCVYNMIIMFLVVRWYEVTIYAVVVAPAF
jgi:uncharacterized membrane protein